MVTVTPQCWRSEQSKYSNVDDTELYFLGIADLFSHCDFYDGQSVSKPVVNTVVGSTPDRYLVRTIVSRFREYEVTPTQSEE